MDVTPAIVDPALIAHKARGGRANAAAATLNAATSSDAVREAAIEFEAVFLAQMLAPMFEGLKSDALFGGGPGEDMYRAMMVEEYGKAIARAGGVGIADMVQREILALQEAASQ